MAWKSRNALIGISVLVLLLLLNSVIALEIPKIDSKLKIPKFVIDKEANTAYIQSNDSVLSIDKFESESGEEVQITLDSSKEKNELCLDFEVNANMIEIKEIKIKGFAWDEDIKAKETRTEHSICYPNIKVKSDTLSMSATYKGKGKTKYNISLDGIIFDPFLIGDPYTDNNLAVRFPFDNSYLPVFASSLQAFSASALTYQEAFNSSTNSGTWTNLANTYDNNWATYGECTLSGDCYLYPIYTKRTADTGAIWQVKHQYATTNITIPQSCWDYNAASLNLAILSHTFYGDGYSEYYCYSSSGWITLLTGPNSPTYSNSVYEEAVWWINQSGYSSYNNTLPNISFYRNNILNLSPTFGFNLLNETNKSIYLNGSEYLNLSNQSVFNDLVNTSLIFWMKPTNITNNVVLDKQMFVAIQAGSFLTQSGGCGLMRATTTIVNNTWYHVANIRDGVSCKLYINGVLENTTTGTGYYWGSNLFELKIGAYVVPGYNYKGYLDELMIFSRALTETEIEFLYKTQSNQSITKVFTLIDETTGTNLDMSKVTGAVMYDDDNQSYIDLKSSLSNEVTLFAANSTKLRLVLTYPNSVVITRYIDISLLNESNIRICANPENTTHYEQLTVSSSQRPVYEKSVFANCYIAADYTRFTYQGLFMLKAYTINVPYYLYVWDSNDNKVILSGLDGSVASYYEIDMLEFAKRTYNLDVMGSGLSINNNATAVNIYFNNQKNDSTSTRIVITRTNTSAIVLDTTETASPNAFIVLFDYTLLNVTDLELFKVEVTWTDTDGIQHSIEQFFNKKGQTGWLDSRIAFVIAMFLTFFGLTFVALRFALSWFGVFIQIAAIIILTLCVPTWYTLLLMAIDIIIGIYCIFTGLTMYVQSAVS